MVEFGAKIIKIESQKSVTHYDSGTDSIMAHRLWWYVQARKQEVGDNKSQKRNRPGNYQTIGEGHRYRDRKFPS
jgi:hypothetical protein